MMPRGFLVDLHRCVGCSACVLACRLENGWPGPTGWRRVLPLNLARHRGGPTYHLSVACHHCERPACLRACPSGAYEKRADGIVVHREERCLGCRYCEMACPFGAPCYDAGRGVMTKCDLCASRLDEGRRPACVSACPTGALQLAGNGAPAASDGSSLLTVPGFEDIGNCRPQLRFRPPRGRRRQELYEALVTTLTGGRNR